MSKQLLKLLQTTSSVCSIKIKKAEVIKLKNNFAHEVMEYKENKTKRDSEKEMDEQLQNI